jgi:MoaA/NifB/PqqE/SkfB family radical SAM enzyme/GT2 family glycosyltransferase
VTAPEPTGPLRLSVIVPVHNGAGSLGLLLASLLGQLDARCELICVDDGSTDTTAPLLDGYPDIRRVTHEVRRGAGAARNSGAAVARGAALLFIDADTRATDPGLLDRVHAYLAAYPDCAAFSGAYLDDNPPGSRFSRYLDRYERSLRPRGDGVVRGSLSGALCVVRRDAFDRLGGFDPSPRAALEDVDLGCRLHAAGHQVRFTDALRVAHRQPALGHYLRELVPRTRHYLHLLRHHRAFNEVMGGGSEGAGRALAALLLLTLPAAAVPALAWLPLPPLAGLLWVKRALWRELREGEGAVHPAWGLCYYLATTLPLLAGGLLGVGDALAAAARRLRADAAVLLAYLRSLLSRAAPGYLILFLTHRCNAHCGHCFDTPQRAAIGQQDELDTARIRRLARRLGPVGHLSLTGGEPLLRDDLAEIVATLYHDGGVRSFSLSTNGSLPERTERTVAAMLRAAPAARLIVTLSFDGLGAEHDRLRGVPGLYQRAVATGHRLARLRQWHPQLKLHACATLFERNQASIEQTLDHLGRCGFDQVELNLMRGTPADPGFRTVAAPVYERARQRVNAANGRSRAGFGLAWLFRRLDRAMFGVVARHAEPWPCGSCVAGRKLAVIQANGDVLPCEMLRDVQPRRAAEFDRFVMGNLAAFDDDLGALLRSPRARRLTRMIRETRCRCSFECAIFATMAYRPWRLWRLFLPGARGAAGVADDAAGARAARLPEG